MAGDDAEGKSRGDTTGTAAGSRSPADLTETVDLPDGRRMAGSREEAARLGETVAPAQDSAFAWPRTRVSGPLATVGPEERHAGRPVDLVATAASLARSVADLRREPDVPERLGRYMVIKRLGAGGMGVVYKAYDPDLDRKVAVKLLLGPATGHARARLLREAQAMARLAHPNVVRVFDVGEVEHQVFVAMDFVDGQSLHEWMEARHPWQAVLELFVQAGQGLAAAHAVGLIHRDCKPEPRRLPSKAPPPRNAVGLHKSGLLGGRLLAQGWSGLVRMAQRRPNTETRSCPAARRAARDGYNGPWHRDQHAGVEEQYALGLGHAGPQRTPAARRRCTATSSTLRVTINSDTGTARAANAARNSSLPRKLAPEPAPRARTPSIIITMARL